MVVKIKRPVTSKKVSEVLAQTTPKRRKKTLQEHFGKLKRGLNGLTYQKKLRDGWG